MLKVDISSYLYIWNISNDPIVDKVLLNIPIIAVVTSPSLIMDPMVMELLQTTNTSSGGKYRQMSRNKFSKFVLKNLQCYWKITDVVHLMESLQFVAELCQQKVVS